MQSPKATPRFLPTLTEVVKPVATSRDAADALSPEASGHARLTEEAMVATVMERLLPGLESQIQEALHHGLQAQMERMMPSLMAELDAVVRAAVRAAVAKALDAADRR